MTKQNGRYAKESGETMPAKYQVIAQDLKEQMSYGQYADATTLPTEFALAQCYGVSRQTIRQALSVLEQERLIEKRQGSGSHILRQTLPASPHRIVAIVTTYITDYIFPSVLREAENVLSAHNCTPSLFATQNQVSNERKILKNLLNMPVAGILVEGTKTVMPNPNLDLYQAFLDKGIPLVFLHGDYPGLPGSLSVLDDNYGGGRMLVEYLHGRGHRQIAGIFKHDDIQGPQRYAGYVDALRDLGLPMDDHRVCWFSTDGKDELFQEGPALQNLQRALDSSTAVVCYNDEIAYRLMNYLHDRGISVPGDMAVVSFDNTTYCEMTVPRITSLSHEPYNAGRVAAELLVERLQGKSCQSVLLPWSLVQRESS